MVEMTQQAEAGHVGGGVRAHRERGVACIRVEPLHRVDDRSEILGCEPARLDRLRRDARADRLGQDEHVPGAAARLLQRLRTRHAAQHAQPVLELGIEHRVATGDCTVCLRRLVAPALEDAHQHLVRHHLLWKSADGQSDARLSPHRVDIGQ